MLMNKMLFAMALSYCFFATNAYSTTNTTASNTSAKSRVVAANEIHWGYLNPLRGDKSPGAADLWGVRTKNIATGMLVRFNRGFASPPHIHNISYRGIVIEGMMHNDSPTAPNKWMPSGSFWTQPAGDNHITAANGDGNLIYLEIDSGPYLVKPTASQFDNGKHAINLHRSNMVWLNQANVKHVNGTNITKTFLWQSKNSDGLNGAMVNLPQGFTGKIKVDAKEFRAIVIKGHVNYQSVDIKSPKGLSAGSYFGSTDVFEHQISVTTAPAVVYIRSNGDYQISAID